MYGIFPVRPVSSNALDSALMSALVSALVPLLIDQASNGNFSGFSGWGV
jgi:hypothetical protein